MKLYVLVVFSFKFTIDIFFFFIFTDIYLWFTVYSRFAGQRDAVDATMKLRDLKIKEPLLNADDGELINQLIKV